ncbi:uncharacterized protein METZ01_LOCUS466061, partial [marine metagenome]
MPGSVDFLSILAALVLRPRHNLVRYHDVYAPNAKISHHRLNLR